MPGIKVSIPVRTHGYTGQRDQFEEYNKEYEVAYDGETVRFVAPSGYGSSIDFSVSELETALAFIKNHDLVKELTNR